MQHFRNPLESLRRPRLLVDAARYGLADYERTAGLRRFLGASAADPRHPHLTELMALESEANDKRIARDAYYSVAYHIELLIAVIAEHMATREGPIS